MRIPLVILASILTLTACTKQGTQIDGASSAGIHIQRLARAEAVGTVVARFNPCGHQTPRGRSTNFDAYVNTRKGAIETGTTTATAARCQ
ncbi:MAG: hypothetical protein ACI9SY_000111 [Candidatus Paceibacteria bacterium]|jgi:hypothetical protein